MQRKKGKQGGGGGGGGGGPPPPSSGSAPSQGKGKKSSSSSGDAPPPVLAYIGLAVLTAVAFAKVLTTFREFVSLDDDGNIMQNKHLWRLDRRMVTWLLRDGVVYGVYEPLSSILKAAQIHASGIPSAQVFGMTSVALHVVNVCVLLHLCRKICAMADGTGKAASVLPLCFVVAAFSVHPLRVQVIGWASCQPYLPASIFSQLALLAHIRTRELEARAKVEDTWMLWLAASLLSLVAAIGSKAAAVPMAGVLVLADILLVPLPASGAGKPSSPSAVGTVVGAARLVLRSIWRNAAALAIAVAGVQIALRANVAHEGSGRDIITNADEVDPYAELLLALKLACRRCEWYVKTTLCPTDLSVRYPIPADATDAANVAPGAALLLAVAVALLAALLRRGAAAAAAGGASSAATNHARHAEAIAFAVASYLVVLAPTLLVTMEGATLHTDVKSLVCDRYDYIPMVLLCPGLAVAGHRAVNSSLLQRPGAIVFVLLGLAAAAALIAEVALTRAFIPVWQTSRALWETAVALDPTDYAAHADLANQLMKTGELETALSHAEQAVAIRPTHSFSLFNLGTVLARVARNTEAVEYLYRAKAINPVRFRTPDSVMNLGIALKGAGRLDEAHDAYTQSIALAPTTNFKAYSNLGNLLMQQSKLREAQTAMRTALRIQPNHMQAQQALKGLESFMKAKQT